MNKHQGRCGICGKPVIENAHYKAVLTGIFHEECCPFDHDENMQWEWF